MQIRAPQPSADRGCSAGAQLVAGRLGLHASTIEQRCFIRYLGMRCPLQSRLPRWLLPAHQELFASTFIQIFYTFDFFEMNKIFFVRQLGIAALIVGIGCAAPAQSTQLAAAPKITNVRGIDSVIEEVNLGPEGTLLWRSIQALIMNPELKDFSKLVDLFYLIVEKPIDAVSWKESESNFRNDIVGRRKLITGGRYGVGISSDKESKKFIVFSIRFDLHRVCLSKLEIQRVYGKGLDIHPTDAPNTLLQDQTGYSHGLSIAPNPGGFDIAPSGCAVGFSVTQGV